MVGIIILYVGGVSPHQGGEGHLHIGPILKTPIHKIAMTKKKEYTHT